MQFTARRTPHQIGEGAAPVDPELPAVDWRDAGRGSGASHGRTGPGIGPAKLQG